MPLHDAGANLTALSVPTSPAGHGMAETAAQSVLKQDSIVLILCSSSHVLYLTTGRVQMEPG